MNEALVSHYRCPDSLVRLGLSGRVSPERGYFSFGGNSVCYGQTSLGSLSKIANNGRRDMSQDVIVDGTTLRLPFDPCELVENLRRERYTNNGYEGKRPILGSKAVRKTYYSLRPLLGIPIRKHFQRFYLRGWEDLFFPSWPVDTSVEQILERLLILNMKAQKVERIPFIWFWPEGASSCLMLTHDVERKAGLAFVPSLMDIDEAFGMKSSFQIVPEGRYPISDDFLALIRARGFEVGIQDLHHDGNLFENRDGFLEQAQLINRYLRQYRALGFRSGRMYRNPEWYEALEASYDMSVPNVAHLEPQRGGCCTAFPYFIGNILELPLTTTQDYSLFHVLGDYSIRLWKRQISLIMQRHGLVSFIAHPDYLMKAKALEVYKDLLAHLVDLRDEEDLWVALPREVNRWWRERSQMKLVDDYGRWRIEGPGQERARLAYATLRDDKLVYTFATAENHRGDQLNPEECELSLV